MQRDEWTTVEETTVVLFSEIVVFNVFNFADLVINEDLL